MVAEKTRNSAKKGKAGARVPSPAPALAIFVKALFANFVAIAVVETCVL